MGTFFPKPDTNFLYDEWMKLHLEAKSIWVNISLLASGKFKFTDFYAHAKHLFYSYEWIFEVFDKLNVFRLQLW